MSSKKLEIIRHLAKGHALTPVMALNRFGCLSLSQRIGELKRQGHRIATHMLKVGPRTRVAQYRLVRK